MKPDELLKDMLAHEQHLRDEGRQVQYELMRAENCDHYEFHCGERVCCHMKADWPPCADTWQDCPLSKEREG